MLFSKENLALAHYDWDKPSGDDLYQGMPSRRLFDRYNGHQVLFIINSCCEQLGNFSAQLCQKLEDLLIHKMPLDVRSEVSVLKWLNGELQKA